MVKIKKKQSCSIYHGSVYATLYSHFCLIVKLNNFYSILVSNHTLFNGENVSNFWEESLSNRIRTR